MAPNASIAPIAAPPETGVRGRWFHAMLGAIVLCVLVPCLLTWARLQGVPFNPNATHPNAPSGFDEWNAGQLAVLSFFTFILCGPGTVVIGGILMHSLRKSRALALDEERGSITEGALRGGTWGFLNLPGYFALTFHGGEFMGLLRVGVLFAVTGASCGAWIAWQAYRERHPARGFLPRFSLRTLIVAVFAWGTLLGLYFPDL
jgi:hypothetical protein